MTDLDIVYLTGALWLVLFVAYAVRVSRRGAFRSKRVESVGETIVMGQGIMQATYWGLDPMVRTLVGLGVSANGVTTIALVLGIAAGAAVGIGYIGAACLLSTLSTLCDILDGQVARMTNTGSDSGELFDAVVDRYTEFALIAGFILYAHASAVLVAIALFALQASFMISYASAKAEANRVEVPRGIMRRHERAACLTLAAGVTPVLGPAIHSTWNGLPLATPFAIGLLIVAMLGTIAGIQRLIWTGRALQSR